MITSEEKDGISIVTIVLNGGKEIEATLLSVINQDFKALEYIIIDGGSTDRTLEIIEKYKSKISKVISGKDGGIYHALNKGISLCNNSIVGAIHCGDTYSKNTLNKVYEAFQETNADIIYGDIEAREDYGDEFILRRLYADHSQLKRNMSIFHPATFIKLSVYRRFGFYDIKYRSASDYDLLLRLYNRGYKFAYVPEVLATFRSGGTSSNDFRLSLTENYQIRLNHQSIFYALYYAFKTISLYLYYRLRRDLLILILGQKKYFEIKKKYKY